MKYLTQVTLFIFLFVTVLLYYFWLCPLSFLQITRAINEKETSNKKPPIPVIPFDRPFFYEYLLEFQPRPRKLEQKFLSTSTQKFVYNYDFTTKE